MLKGTPAKPRFLPPGFAFLAELDDRRLKLIKECRKGIAQAPMPMQCPCQSDLAASRLDYIFGA